MPDLKHRWSDVSYHGSPWYECDFCKTRRTYENIDEDCPEAAVCLAREAKETEQAERLEYEDLKRRREREFYLESKYGKIFKY